LTLGFRPYGGLLLRDRSWVELRWIDGKYSTTYRNRPTAEHDFLVHGFRFTPYGAFEIFYDTSKSSWDQRWYIGGVQLPYKRLFMLDAYYRRENCPACDPANVNVAGMTLNFFFANSK
jgi:hypothetical protein